MNDDARFQPSPPAHPDERDREAALLHALGALTPGEAAAFEAHVAAGCKACAQELRAFCELVGSLGEAAGEAASTASGGPPAALREKLLAKAASSRDVQVWKSWAGGSGSDANPGMLIHRAGDADWQETAARGVKVRPLRVDSTRRYVTMLVRMEPGSSYPRHVHAGGEECFVLEGELRVGDETLRAGDYQYAESGSSHGVQSTERGCLLLIVSSQEDELI